MAVLITASCWAQSGISRTWPSTRTATAFEADAPQRQQPSGNTPRALDQALDRRAFRRRPVSTRMRHPGSLGSRVDDARHDVSARVPRQPDQVADLRMRSAWREQDPGAALDPPCVYRNRLKGFGGDVRVTVLETAGRDPGGREPAPDLLGHVQAVVNTRNALTGADLWATPELTRQWLAGLVPDAAGLRLTHDQWERLVTMRELIRVVLAAHRNREAPPHTVFAALSEILSVARLQPSLNADGQLSLSPQGGLYERFCGALANVVVAAQQAGTWTRLKSCPGDHCGWAYYDRSPANGSRWCSMSVCGGRAKARATRQRKRTARS